MSKAAARTLSIVLDTSALHTRSAAFLVRQSITNLAGKHADHPDLNLQWWLPDLVVEERRYQMYERASRLLEGLQKVEELLDMRLRIDKTTLQTAIDRRISVQISAFAAGVLRLDTNRVAWRKLIEKSVNRHPPFGADGERGFRDALIAETFYQFVAASSTDHTGFVAADGALHEAVSSTVDDSSIRVFSSVEELEGYINTLLADVPEEIVQQYAERAAQLFSGRGNESLFVREQVPQRLADTYQEAFEWKIPGSVSRRNGLWKVHPPIFVKRESNRWYWSSPVHRYAAWFDYRPTIFTPSGGVIGSSDHEVIAESDIGADILSSSTSYSSFETASADVVFGSNEIAYSFNFNQPSQPMRLASVSAGETVFNIAWSVEIELDELRNARIESLDFEIIRYT